MNFKIVIDQFIERIEKQENIDDHASPQSLYVTGLDVEFLLVKRIMRTAKLDAAAIYSPASFTKPYCALSKPKTYFSA